MLQALKDKISGKPKVTREQMLAVRPMRHPKIEWAREPRKSDEVNVALLRIPRLRGKWADFVAKWLQVPDYKKVELDEIGSDVWEMCNGSSNVEAIAKAIGASYRLNRRQAEVSVTAYLKMLAERRLIALRSASTSKATAPAKGTRKRAA
ncbi:MAG: PqqD family protein [Fibrella sp.]|nr:PqqD family protein [Armatimonadota bacterium]